ncbi:retrovirus-related pol polyprotein from transposon TNT 1-94 [Tanacetum coccineum]
MDSIIPLRQKNTLVEYMILSGADNRPPMLDKDLTKKYVELSAVEKIQANCDMKATNIILQGLPANIYSLERECKLYDAFDKFTHIKGETLHKYYLRFTQLINDMNIYNMKIEQFQLYAFLKQHELHANEVRLMRERNQDPLAFVANQQMTPPHFNTYQSSYNNSQLQQQFSPSHFVVPVFSPGDDLISSLNKAMAFLTVVASSRFPSTNQLRTSLNPRNQATIQDGRVIVQQVQGRQGQSYSGTGYKSNATSSGGNNTSGQARVVKCYNCQGEGHMARQCTRPKRLRNAAWYKEKAMLAEA